MLEVDGAGRGLGAAVGGGAGAGDDAGEDGSDGVARMRRCAMMGSNSSYGRLNSSRKNGCPERFSDGDGERIDTGDEFERGEWYPSASMSYIQRMDE